MESQISYALPNLCANCGERPGTKERRIEYSFTTNYVLVRRTKYYILKILLCDPCWALFEGRSPKRTRLIAAFIIGGILVPFLLLLLSGNGLPYAVAQLNPLGLIGAAVGFFIGFALATRYGSDSDIAQFDGRYFAFRNERFHNEFRALNPEITMPFPKPTAAP